MAFITPSEVEAGDPLTETLWNQDVVENTISLPRGFVARAQRTVNQGSISSTVDLTSLTVTFTADATRRYKTTLILPYNEQATTNGYQQFLITDGSNVQKAGSTQFAVVAQGSFCQVIAYEQGISGSQTRKGRANTSAGSFTSNGSASEPASILVEDIGAV
jgi:hypothetical protein